MSDKDQLLQYIEEKFPNITNLNKVWKTIERLLFKITKEFFVTSEILNTNYFDSYQLGLVTEDHLFFKIENILKNTRVLTSVAAYDIAYSVYGSLFNLNKFIQSWKDYEKYHEMEYMEFVENIESLLPEDPKILSEKEVEKETKKLMALGLSDFKDDSALRRFTRNKLYESKWTGILSSFIDNSQHFYFQFISRFECKIEEDKRFNDLKINVDVENELNNIINKFIDKYQYLNECKGIYSHLLFENGLIYNIIEIDSPKIKIKIIYTDKILCSIYQFGNEKLNISFSDNLTKRDQMNIDSYVKFSNQD